MIIGKRLKEARLKKSMSQEELGNLLGVSKVSICGYEKGTRTPTMENFLDLIKILELEPDYVLGRDNTDNEKLYELTKDNSKYKIARLVETTWPLAIIKIIKDWFNENDVIEFYKERVQKLKNLQTLNISIIKK